MSFIKLFNERAALQPVVNYKAADNTCLLNSQSINHIIQAVLTCKSNLNQLTSHVAVAVTVTCHRQLGYSAAT